MSLRRVPGGSALDAARAALAEQGLSVPPVPLKQVAHLRQVDRLTWSTRPDITDLTGPRWFAEQAVNRDCTDYLAFGAGGYGAASQAMHYYLVDGPLGLFIQVGWGNSYADRTVEGARVEAVFSSLRSLFGEVDDLLARADFTPSGRLIVIDADYEVSGWHVFAGAMDHRDFLTTEWTVATDPLSAVRAATSAPPSR